MGKKEVVVGVMERKERREEARAAAQGPLSVRSSNSSNSHGPRYEGWQPLFISTASDVSRTAKQRQSVKLSHQTFERGE